MRVQQAEGVLLTNRQRGRPVVEYIREFRRLAGKVRGWPEKLLVHQFKTGLDRTLRQACVTRGLPPCLVAWAQATTEIDAELCREDRSRFEWPVRWRALSEQPTRTGPVPQQPVSPASPKATPMRSGPVRSVLICFRYGTPGHRAVECCDRGPKCNTTGTPGAS